MTFGFFSEIYQIKNNPDALSNNFFAQFYFLFVKCIDRITLKNEFLLVPDKYTVNLKNDDFSEETSRYQLTYVIQKKYF